MKKGIHPEYRDVVFKDVSCDFEIITKSTIKTTDKITVNGKEYPLFKVDISSGSHPFTLELNVLWILKVVLIASRKNTEKNNFKKYFFIEALFSRAFFLPG
jgi:ribosomal protein L31